ncbi:MAG: hypothetical protein R6V56_02925 [Lentisphaeria bacterium]
MKKTAVICIAADRAHTVDRLGDLGIVHVVEVEPPRSTELNELISYRDQVEKAVNLLSSREPRRHHTGGDLENREIRDLVEDTIGTNQEINHTRERLDYWRRIHEQVLPWGSFDLNQLETLKQRGLDVRLCTAPRDQLPQLPPGAVLEEISRIGKRVYFAIFIPDGVEIQAELPEIQLPAETRLDHINHHIDECRKSISELKHSLDHYATVTDRIKQHLEEVETKLQFMQARESMGTTQELCYLEGFVPEAAVDSLREAARQHGWGLFIRDPEEADSVPTKITLPKWARPIRIVMEAMGILPGYREVDISAWFMVFLSIFFAMLIGDAGYGALFFTATLVARAKFRKAPSQPFWLVGVFAVTTMIWGVLNGTYFGMQSNIWAPLADLKLTWLTGPDSQNNIMWLCFLLGAVHLSIAHTWNAIVYGKTLKALREVGWVGVVWGNFYLAQMLVIGNEEAVGMVKMLYLPGLVIVVLVTMIKEFGFVNILLMAFGFINAFVDVVSYIRLYAVGMATVAVAQSFNSMATGLDLPVWIKPLVMILILLLGHTLNIALGAMSVLVHGVRLNVLEFSQHLNLEWTGVKYTPLSKR